MQKNFKRQQQVRMKCLDCDSTDIKSRKNFSHGSSSKGKKSYYCAKCRSNKIEVEQSRFQRR